MRFSDRILGLSYGAMLVSVMAIAEGQWAADYSLSPNAYRLLSEADIPAEESVWSACCDHRDCMEAKINVAYQAGDLARVAIGAYPIFDLEAAKIFRSTNGKSYFCRSNVSKPPDRENTRCVFHGAPKYVRR